MHWVPSYAFGAFAAACGDAFWRGAVASNLLAGPTRLVLYCLELFNFACLCSNM